MTVWAYARVSTVEQAAEGRSSLDDQIRRCRGVAMTAGLDEPVQIIDPGVSGSIPLKDRPEGGKMFAALKPGDYVIAAKLDRLFRSALDALHSVESMKADGVRLILADISSDPVTESAIAKMFLTILSGVAEFEKYRILERMRDGRAGKKKQHNGLGHIGGLAPYGYRKIGSGRDAKLEPDPQEQAIIAIINRLVASGVSQRATAKRLDHMGLTTRTGKKWTVVQIGRVLRRNSPTARE